MTLSAGPPSSGWSILSVLRLWNELNTSSEYFGSLLKNLVITLAPLSFAQNIEHDATAFWQWYNSLAFLAGRQEIVHALPLEILRESSNKQRKKWAQMWIKQLRIFLKEFKMQGKLATTSTKETRDTYSSCQTICGSQPNPFTN
jgi:hypothetical protein